MNMSVKKSQKVIFLKMTAFPFDFIESFISEAVCEHPGLCFRFCTAVFFFLQSGSAREVTMCFRAKGNSATERNYADSEAALSQCVCVWLQSTPLPGLSASFLFMS